MEVVAMIQQADATLEDVEVRGEVERVADDAIPFGAQGQGAQDQLEEVDRCRISHHDLARCCAEEPGKLVPHPLGRLIPTAVPGPDEVAPPFALHGLAKALYGPARKASQGVAIHVDEVGFRKEKGIAKGSELVLGVQTLGEREPGLTVPGLKVYVSHVRVLSVPGRMLLE
jgi:hypothetical protein